MTQTVFAREVVSGGTAALPSLDTRLTVVRAADLRPGGPARPPEAPTRVEDLRLNVGGRRSGTAELVVARPSFPGDLQGESEGEPYLVRWINDRGVHEVPTRYVSRERIGPALLGWRLRVTGSVSRIQRRAHARIDLAVPVKVVVLDDVGRGGRPAGVGVLRGTTLNVSEGGLLAALEPPASAVGAPVVVRFTVAGEVFVLSGRVVRHQPAPGQGVGGLVTAVAFDDPDAHGDRLRPLLFACQLHGRRNGLP